MRTEKLRTRPTSASSYWLMPGMGPLLRLDMFSRSAWLAMEDRGDPRGDIWGVTSGVESLGLAVMAPEPPPPYIIRP